MKNNIAIATFLAANYSSIDVLKYRKGVCSLPASGKYVIFSDLHQGAFAWNWDQHDFFWKNKDLYLHLLSYYYQTDYTLIEAGDIEEFWLKRWKMSFKEQWEFQRENFAELYDIRRKFHKAKRFVKIRGNHDNLWMYENRVKTYLWDEALLHHLSVHEFAILGNDFLIMHGHQVDPRNRDIDCKKGIFWTKMGSIVEFFTDTKFYGRKKPRSGWDTHPQADLIHSRSIEHDIYHKAKLNLSYAKLAQLLNIYLVIGHTHAPKWLPAGDFTFNTGCGVFEGIIYGIEINYDEDIIRLVDWNDDAGLPEEPKSLCQKPISELKTKLNTP